MAEKRSKQRKKLEEKLEEILPLAEVKIMAKGMVGFSPNEIIDDCSLSRATYYKVAPNATTIYISVSYTHLDVYKRQEHILGFFIT